MILKQVMKNKRIIAICSGVAIALSLGAVSSNYRGYVLSIDNHPVTYAMSTEVLTTAMEEAQAGINQRLELKNVYIANERKINTAILSDKQINLTQKEILKDIGEEVLTLKVKGVGLIMDGKHKEYFETEADAQKAIDNTILAKANLQPGETLKNSTVNNHIRIEEADFPITELSFSKDSKIGQEMIAKKEKNEPQEGPEVQKVSALGVIENPIEATALTEIQTAEPLVEGNKIETELDVVIQKDGTEVEVIPFQIETIVDETKEYGSPVEVLQEGKNGEITRNVTITIHGDETAKTINSEAMTAEPVNQVIVIGPDLESYRNLRSLSGLFSNVDMILPAEGIVTSIDKPGSHDGGRALDIANDTGTEIYAPFDGIVTLSRYNGGYGNAIEIENTETGFSTVLGHMSQLIANEGDRVTKGQVIGLMGSTGNSTGPHIHFELLYQGERQTIQDYFNVGMDQWISLSDPSWRKHQGSGLTVSTGNPYIANASDLDFLYRAVAAEAGGESYEGMVAVASAIIYTSEVKGISITETITAPNQYSVVSDGSIHRVNPSETVIRAVNDAINGLRVLDPQTQYFYAPGSVSSPWHESLTYTGTIGGHRFFKAN
ncbi:MAG: peptidoglycan DD-metalloendopeptidase family protein [Eubacteriaceae bacterium]